jgi:hypothetical protein
MICVMVAGDYKVHYIIICCTTLSCRHPMPCTEYTHDKPACIDMCSYNTRMLLVVFITTPLLPLLIQLLSMPLLFCCVGSGRAAFAFPCVPWVKLII